MSCKPKEFYGKEGAVGSLAWTNSSESVLHISKCSEDRKVEYASCQLQGRALTWWNIQIQTRGREGAYRLSWEEKFAGLKKFGTLFEVSHWYTFRLDSNAIDFIYSLVFQLDYVGYV